MVDVDYPLLWLFDYFISFVLYACILTCQLKINNNNNNNNNNNTFPETRKYWVDVQQGISKLGISLMSLALVGNPSRDGVSTKILVWRHLKPNTQLL